MVAAPSKKRPGSAAAAATARRRRGAAVSAESRGITPLIVLYKMGGVYPHIIHFLGDFHGLSGSPILGSLGAESRSPDLSGSPRA